MLPSGASVAKAGGAARRAPDPAPRTMSADDKITIASVSKTITAAAILQLLARNKEPLRRTTDATT
jgi:CubicO group peptidase (beta-lactamase class C family)